MAGKLFNRLHTHIALPLLASALMLVGLLSGLLTAPVAQARGDEPHSYPMPIVAHDNGTNPTNATHFWYAMPDSVHAGLVEVKFSNDGTQSHMAQFFKLKDDVSQAQFTQALAQVGAPGETGPQIAAALRHLLTLASAAGGANSIMPGAQQDVLEHLTSGRYVVVCFDTTPAGVPHFLLGMNQLFTVWGEDEFTAPKSAGLVIERDHQIILPDVLHENGNVTLQINVYDQTHEFDLARVPAGTTKQELLDCLTGKSCKLKAPPMDAGGAGAIAPGGTHWVELHLAPGTYVAWCFVPDIHTGMPHALMGMITVFTVEDY